MKLSEPGPFDSVTLTASRDDRSLVIAVYDSTVERLGENWVKACLHSMEKGLGAAGFDVSVEAMRLAREKF